MEENSKDIQRLIKITRQRPSFSRMISWEMSQAANTEITKKVKPKKRQKSKSDGLLSNSESDCTKEKEVKDDDCESTGSSDYETANEEVEDELDHSDAFMSLASLNIADIDEEVFDDEAEDSDDDDEDDVDNDEDVEGFPASTATGGLQPARRRRPSKRQKRNKKNLFKISYTDDLNNLGNLFDLKSDLDIALQEADEAQATMTVQCPVPTLVELCLQSMKKDRKRQKSGSRLSTSTILPYRIKRIMTKWNFQQNILEKQLSFLQNFVLPSVCKDNCNLGCSHNAFSPVNTIRHPLRCVWSTMSYPVSDEIQELYPTKAAAAFLYQPNMRIFENLNLRFDDVSFLIKVSPSSIHIQSAFATTIDLMLPHTMGERTLPKICTTETDVMSRAITTMIMRVKIALKLRYPQLVLKLFERVLPYVMWARGNVGIATSMFQSLIEKEDGYLNKAMYLSEIAVMHQMFAESQTAESFYKLASEMTLTEESDHTAINQVTEQTQILLASVYDCGELNHEKSLKAVRHWSSAVHLPKSPNSCTTALAAVSSYLGLHLTYTTENPWNEAATRISSWICSYKYLYYHVALVQALQGNGEASTDAFREFKGHCGMFLPGQDIHRYLDKKEKRNPFSPLINMVKGQGHHVQPMEVVWRTQFRPPRLTKDIPVETDLASPELNLCISEDGLLTGDMQMLMPPIRQVNLDLLTGAVVFTNIPSQTGTWQTLPPEQDKHMMVNLMLPTPQQVYSDEDGTSVHLISPSLSPCHLPIYNGDYNLPACPMTLTWRNAAGQTARLNLITITKGICQQALDTTEAERKWVVDHLGYTMNVQQVTSRTSKLKLLKATDLNATEYSKFSSLKLRLVEHLMSVVYNKNLSMDMQEISSAAQTILNKNNSSRKKQKATLLKKGQSTSKEDRDPAKLYVPKSLPAILKHYTLEIIGKPFQYGKCLVMQLKLHATKKLFYLMFMDTSSRARFQDYTMVRIGNSKPDIPRQGRLGTAVTDAKYFMYMSNSFLKIHNESGDFVDSLDLNSLKENGQTGHDRLCIVGGYLFGINKSRLSIWRHIIGSEFSEDELEINTAMCLASYWNLPGDGKKQIEDVVVMGTEVQGKGKFLVLHMSVGIGFIDPDTMELIPIAKQTNCGRENGEEDDKVLLEKVEEIKILAQKSFTEEDRAVTGFAVGLANKVLVFEVSHELGSQQMQATLVNSLVLPGKAVEVCFVGKKMGLLVSLTQHDDRDLHYTEHVFYFANDGTLLQVLLCVGQGPHSFCPVYMHNPENTSDKSGWYVYMRDGRDGIVCARLTHI